MKTKLFKKVIVIIILCMGIIPVGANAEWKQNSTGWWYTQGNSYSIGWNQIYGQWYYFNSNGYMKTGWLNDGGTWYYLNPNGSMAANTTIDGYYLAANGKMQDNSTSASNGNGLIKGSSNYIYHTPGSRYYDKTTNVQRWFKTVEEAEAAGYRAPQK